MGRRVGECRGAVTGLAARHCFAKPGEHRVTARRILGKNGKSGGGIGMFAILREGDGANEGFAVRFELFQPVMLPDLISGDTADDENHGGDQVPAVPVP